MKTNKKELASQVQIKLDELNESLKKAHNAGLKYSFRAETSSCDSRHQEVSIDIYETIKYTTKSRSVFEDTFL